MGLKRDAFRLDSFLHLNKHLKTFKEREEYATLLYCWTATLLYCWTYQEVCKSAVIEDWKKEREVAKYRYRFYASMTNTDWMQHRTFNISRRTLYRWRAKLKYSKRVIKLQPRSSRPITSSRTNPLIIKKITEVRVIYPNISKDKIFHLQEFRDYCNLLNCKIPSISTQNHC